MKQQQLPVAAKDVIETSRKSLVEVLDAGRGTIRRTLHACDQVFVTGTGTLARAPVLVRAGIRDELVSLEGQMTLLASVLAQSTLDQAERVTNVAAGAATRIADDFERVFDLRVMQALERLGVPAGAMVQEIADRVAALTRELNRMLQALPIIEAVPSPAAKTRTARKPAKANAARSGKRRARTVQ